MINRILNLDAYDLIPLGVVVFLIGSFTIPAYNQFTYDANLNHVEQTEKVFSSNLKKFQENWYDFGGSFESIEFNDYNIFPNKDGYAGGEGVSGTALTAYDCQNIFYALTDTDYLIEIGKANELTDISKDTEYVVSFNENDFVCSYTYIDRTYVKRLRNKKTHIIKYNTKTGESNLFKNGYTFK